MADSGDENIAATSSFNSNLKKKRRYDVRFKLDALAYAEKYSGEKAAKQFGVDSRQIRGWKKRKAIDLLAISDDHSFNCSFAIDKNV
jgi:transposase-like protein